MFAPCRHAARGDQQKYTYTYHFINSSVLHTFARINTSQLLQSSDLRIALLVLSNFKVEYSTAMLSELIIIYSKGAPLPISFSEFSEELGHLLYGTTLTSNCTCTRSWKNFSHGIYLLTFLHP